MKINTERQWMYKLEGDGRIFEVGEEIHHGWYSSPDPKWAKPMWGDDLDDKPDIEPDVVDLPVDDDAPEAMYCAECDKVYTDKYWYVKHMLEKHGVEVE